MCNIIYDNTSILCHIFLNWFDSNLILAVVSNAIPRLIHVVDSAQYETWKFGVVKNRSKSQAVPQGYVPRQCKKNTLFRRFP